MEPLYIQGLREWDNDRQFLLDTLYTEQDTFISVCEQLDILDNKVKDKIEME